MNRYMCQHCNGIVRSRNELSKCQCGGALHKIIGVPNLGIVSKRDSYNKMITDGTECFTVDQFRKVYGESEEELKRLRKSNELAVGDSVRPQKHLADSIIDNIERFTNTELSDDEKSTIQQMEGVVNRVNTRRNEYFINWGADVKSAAEKYNGDRFDFFDLDGNWGSWDLNRVITSRDVGRVGRIEDDQGSIASVG